MENFDWRKYSKAIIPFAVALIAQPAIIALLPGSTVGLIDAILAAMVGAGYAAPANKLPLHVAVSQVIDATK